MAARHVKASLSPAYQLVRLGVVSLDEHQTFVAVAHLCVADLFQTFWAGGRSSVTLRVKYIFRPKDGCGSARRGLCGLRCTSQSCIWKRLFHF